METFNTPSTESVTERVAPEETVQGEQVEAVADPFPAVDSETLTFHFRKTDDTPANREKHTVDVTDPNYSHVKFKYYNDEDNNNRAVFCREAESYSVDYPTPVYFGFPVPDEGQEEEAKQYKVLEFMIKEAFSKYARKNLINEYKPITNANCNWDIIYKDIYDSITATGGIKIDKELVDSMSQEFRNYRQAMNAKKAGIDVICGLIEKRFGLNSVKKYIEGLDMIRAQLADFYAEALDEAGQAKYESVMEMLLDRIEVAQQPPEAVDIEDLFG